MASFYKPEQKPREGLTVRGEGFQKESVKPAKIRYLSKFALGNDKQRSNAKQKYFIAVL